MDNIGVQPEDSESLDPEEDRSKAAPEEPSPGDSTGDTVVAATPVEDEDGSGSGGDGGSSGGDVPGASHASEGVDGEAMEDGLSEEEEDEAGVADVTGDAAAGGEMARATRDEEDGEAEHATDADGSAPRSRAMSASSSAATAELRRPSSRDSTIGSGSRPNSAAFRDLRGSRPNSAAVAAQIEGFDLDFQGTALVAGALPEVPEYSATVEGEEWLPEDEEACPVLDQQVLAAEEEGRSLQAANEALQRRTRAVLDARSRGRPAAHHDITSLDGLETRYRSALKQWAELREERERVEAHYQAQLFSMKATLEERLRQVADVTASFTHFKHEVARSAVYSKTGKPISTKVLAEIEEKGTKARLDEELQHARLRNIHLSNSLKRAEQARKEKEQLAEGLHLIDFEQLKIENLALNEKIEERNEELIKLRRRTRTTVQILTHMKEKLQFMERENGGLAVRLAELDAGLAERRDKLARVKSTRDKLRAKSQRIQEHSVYVTDPQLLRDLQAQRERRDDLAVELEQLRVRHAALVARTARTSSLVVAASQEVVAARASLARSGTTRLAHGGARLQGAGTP